MNRTRKTSSPLRILLIASLIVCLGRGLVMAESSSPAPFPVSIDEFYVNDGWSLTRITIDPNHGYALKGSEDGVLYKDFGFDLSGSTVKARFRNEGSYLKVAVYSKDRSQAHVLVSGNTGSHDYVTHEWVIPSDLCFVPTILHWAFGSPGPEASIDRLEIWKMSSGSAPLQSPCITLESPIQAIKATWLPVPDAQGYRIMVNGETEDVGDALQYQASRLTPRSVATVSVQAYNTYGSGPFSRPQYIVVEEGTLVPVFTNDFDDLQGIRFAGFQVDPLGAAIKVVDGEAYVAQTTSLDDLRGCLIRVTYTNAGGALWLRVNGQDRQELLYYSLPFVTQETTVGEWFVPPSLDFAPTGYSWTIYGPQGSKIDSVTILRPLTEDEVGQESVFWASRPRVYYTVQGRVELHP